MNIGAVSSAYGFNPLQHLLGTLFQQQPISTGQNSPLSTSSDAETSSQTTSPAPSSPGKQFASHTLAALLGVQQQAQAPSAADIAGKLISQADADGDGSLSQDEITKALGLDASSTSSSNIQSAIAKLDTDGDGKLSSSELTAAIQQRMNAGEAHHHHRHGEHQELSSSDLASKIIGAGDSDKDGSLSQTELSAELGKAGASMSSTDLANAFKKVDSNGDGLLSGAELAAAIDALRAKHAQSTTSTATASSSTSSTTAAATTDASSAATA